ncbi:MAG: hypothetical protein EP348_13105 [Alphaproteobacteria bacterium]|nr:MAG: hypothetical protein EP348_13105 [Alphaproteobacteria bacterium]
MVSCGGRHYDGAVAVLPGNKPVVAPVDELTVGVNEKKKKERIKVMKRRFLFRTTLMAGAALAAATMLSGTSMAKDQGRFATFLSPKNPVVEYGAVPFMKRVEKDSKGDLSFKLYAGGSLLGGKNMVQGLRDGVADIGQIVFGYYPAEFPYASLIADMAIYGSYPPAISAAVTEFNFLHCKGCLEDYKRNGLVVLGSASTSTYELLGKEDVSKVESLKGMKVRAAGALWARWLNYVGAIPVSMPSSEMYESLSRGQVDVVMQPLGAMKSHSIWDIAHKATMLDLGTYRSWGIFSVSAKYWATLSVPEREILMKNAAIGLIDTSKGYMAKDEEVLKMAKEKHVELIQPSEGLRKSVTDFLKSDRATVIETAKTKYKIADPEPLMDTLIALIEKWEKKFAPIKDDNKAMSDMLWNEVLSKVDVKTLGN